MLNLVMITYNDMPLIQKCVESVIDHVDRIIAADGIFSDFPHLPEEPGYSTDGTLAYLSSLDKEVILIRAPEMQEVEKRNEYLIAQPGDWYLHLDTDEWVENPEVMRDLPDVDFLHCPMRREDGNVSCYARLFRHVEGIHYEGLHHRLVDGQGRLITSINQDGDVYKGERFPLTIWHNRDQRDAKRLERKSIYYKTLTEREHEIKEMIAYGVYGQ